MRRYCVLNFFSPQLREQGPGRVVQDGMLGDGASTRRDVFGVSTERLMLNTTKMVQSLLVSTGMLNVTP